MGVLIGAVFNLDLKDAPGLKLGRIRYWFPRQWYAFEVPYAPSIIPKASLKLPLSGAEGIREGSDRLGRKIIP